MSYIDIDNKESNALETLRKVVIMNLSNQQRLHRREGTGIKKGCWALRPGSISAGICDPIL